MASSHPLQRVHLPAVATTLVGLAVSVVVVVALLGETLPLRTATAATGPEIPRIMYVGDSITHGNPGEPTWRYFLEGRLAETGWRHDAVGPVDTTDRGAPAGVEWDRDHASVGGRGATIYAACVGWCVEHCGDGGDGCPTNGRSQGVADLAEQNPDLVVVMLGVNDLTWAWAEGELVVGALASYIGEAQQLNPNIDVLVMTVLPVLAGPDVDPVAFDRLLGELDDLNTGLANLPGLSTPTSRVRVGDSGVGFVPELHLADTVHPNVAGSEVIAHNVEAALAQLGVT